MKGKRQLTRMDYHPKNTGHGGKSTIERELKYWPDSPYRYHIYTWDGMVVNQ